MDIFSLNAVGKASYEKQVQDFYTYYNRNVTNNRQKMNSLIYYKSTGYTFVNGLLIKNMQFPSYGFLEDVNKSVNENNNSEKKLTIYDVLQSMNISGIISQSIKTIKDLDKMIYEAPKMTKVKNLVLYRGTNHDIQQDFICGQRDKDTYYYTTPSYMSTSFSPITSMDFAQPNSCGIFISIVMPSNLKGLQGMFVNWKMVQGDKFENAEIDSEFEFILPRLTKFKVEKIDYIPYHYKYAEHKYNEIPCRIKMPVGIKHYTLSIVSQPSMKDLSTTYKTLTDNVKISIEPKDFKDIPLTEYLKEKKKNTSKHTNAL